ncbi:MAG: hypothetical protein HOP34_10110 [Methylococcaceae bacterium]|nr:hypothetical protein [Methylococcaceae bacterium]
MRNQEQENSDNLTEPTEANNRRRFIKGLGGITPVLLTLTSPSILGGEMCLSQQLSGNVSGTTNGACVKGQNPTFWRNGSSISLWQTAGLVYGTRITSPTNNGTLCSHYTGGTAFNVIFGGNTTTPLRQLLCSNVTNSTAIWIAAYLNAAAIPNYILTKQQVLELYTGALAPPPPYPNANSGRTNFLKSTW